MEDYKNNIEYKCLKAFFENLDSYMDEVLEFEVNSYDDELFILKELIDGIETVKEIVIRLQEMNIPFQNGKFL